MEIYRKPIIANKNFSSGLIPWMLGPVFGAIKVGAPVLAGLAAIAASKKGNTIIDSTHTSALTARKEFVFA